MIDQVEAMQAPVDELTVEAQMMQARKHRIDAIDSIRAMIANHGITLEELGLQPQTPKRPKKKIAPKYRDAAGNTWTGRGLKPRWLAAALATGKSLDDFAI